MKVHARYAIKYFRLWLSGFRDPMLRLIFFGSKLTDRQLEEGADYLRALLAVRRDPGGDE